MGIEAQVAFSVILSVPIASVSWAVTHEEILREPREWCVGKSKTCSNLFQRKLYYLFTCEFCFSHYVAAAFLLVTRSTLLYEGWRGYLIAEFVLVWLANFQMTIFNRLRLQVKHEKLSITEDELKSGK